MIDFAAIKFAWVKFNWIKFTVSSLWINIAYG
jgi:hypothetical protein